MQLINISLHEYNIVMSIKIKCIRIVVKKNNNNNNNNKNTDYLMAEWYAPR